MNTITINGYDVNVIKTNVKFNGREWYEIETFPRIIEHRLVHENSVYEYSEDWLVMDNDEFSLYMNNSDGYMVYIGKQKDHYDKDKGLVTDKKGRILYTTI